MSTPEVEPAPPFKPRHTTAQRAVLAINIIVVIALHLATATAAGLLIHRFVERPLLSLLRPRVRIAAASRR